MTNSRKPQSEKLATGGGRGTTAVKPDNNMQLMRSIGCVSCSSRPPPRRSLLLCNKTDASSLSLHTRPDHTQA